MSNGKFTYTKEQEASLFAQFSKAMEIVRERQRPYETVKQSLQAIISDCEIQIKPKILAGADGDNVFHVTGNFGSASLALDAGKYDARYGYAESARAIAKVPMIVQPVDCKVRAVPLGQFRKNAEIFGLYPKIAGPMTLFTLGVKFPEKQFGGSIFVIWKDHKGQFWYAFLGGTRGWRSVNVCLEDPNQGWASHDHVLLYE